MDQLVPVALLGWIPLILLIFAVLPPRQAVIFSYIAAWLFLPYAGYDLPGLPAYTKRTATSLGVLLGMALFCSDWLLALRPRWFDLPMATWCLCPIASSLSNGLGIYDGFASTFDYIVAWGLPYLTGRAAFTRLEHLREMAIGIVLGGLSYVPLCLWEIRMSPRLHIIIYGFDPSGWGEIVYGGYRPKVFMSCGLELGLWMAATSITAVWLWASGSLRQLWGISFGWFVSVLLIVTVFCKVTGSWILLIMGVSLWYLLKWTGSRLPAIALVLLPTLYMTTRSAGLWTGEGAVRLVQTLVNERRAQSLQFRMYNEDILVNRALQQPIFGWGGWGRARVRDEAGNDISITDGMWVIAIGNNGLVGLLSFNAALLLPMVLLVRRCPIRDWVDPAIAPTCALATLAALYSIDCIANAMLNPIYYLGLGGLTGVLGMIDRETMESICRSNHELSINHLYYYDYSNGSDLSQSDTRHVGVADPREEAAIRLGSLGRSLMEKGMTREAEEAWQSALQHWSELAADYPEDLGYRESWLDGLNDAAWSLISPPELEDCAVSRALQLAEQVIGFEPGNAAYWNTLGTAYFRAAEWSAAIHALERSVELSGGGTGFDYFFLSMAYYHNHNLNLAYHWYSRANAWMEECDPEHGDLLRFREEARALLDCGSLPAYGKFGDSPP